MQTNMQTNMEMKLEEINQSSAGLMLDPKTVNFWGVNVQVPGDTRYLASDFDRRVYAYSGNLDRNHVSGRWEPRDGKATLIGTIEKEHHHYIWSRSLQVFPVSEKAVS